MSDHLQCAVLAMKSNLTGALVPTHQRAMQTACLKASPHTRVCRKSASASILSQSYLSA